LPRCVAYCIHRIKESRDVIEASITMSCIEIYQEQLKDLISPSTSSKLQIKISPSGETYVEHLTQKFIQSSNDALKMIEIIKLNRTKNSKNSKYSSHRSHCLVCLTVRQKLSNSASRRAKCYFGDLAGSEESDNNMFSDASINVLKLVVHSLSAKKAAIPYTNSALTTLLKDSLGGNTKTTMICTCCMHLFKRDETINTLRFGQRARLIENAVKQNRELSRSEMKKVIERQKLQIDGLQSQLKQLLIQQPQPRNMQSASQQSISSTGVDESTEDTLHSHNEPEFEMTDHTEFELKELREIKVKYEKLQQQYAAEKAKSMTQHDRYHDLEEHFEDFKQRFHSLQQEQERAKSRNGELEETVKRLQADRTQYMSNNDVLNQKIKALSDKNTQLQAISRTILNQLDALEKQLETQQDEIRAFEHTHLNAQSRKSYDNTAYSPRSSSAMDDDSNVHQENMARGSVIIHKLIPLPLSTTTPSTSPANNNNAQSDAPLMYPHQDDTKQSDNDNDDDNAQTLQQVRDSHKSIKQSLFNLREVLEANFIAAAEHKKSHKNNDDSKKVTTELIAQYNNVMEQYNKLQRDYNETQKLLSERHEEILMLQKQNKALRIKNEKLQYETERIKAEYKQRKEDLEKSIDQSKINMQRSYLDHKFNPNQTSKPHSNTNHDNDNDNDNEHKANSNSSSHSKSGVLSSEHIATSMSPSNPTHKKPLLLSSDSVDSTNMHSLKHQHSRENSVSNSSTAELDILVGSQSLPPSLDASPSPYGSYMSNASFSSANSAVSTPYLNPSVAGKPSSKNKLAAVPEKTKQDEWRAGLRQRFEWIDEDHDGFISLEDFTKFTKQKNPSSSDEQIKKIFSTMDTRQTGRVTWVEFERCFRRYAMKNMALKRLQAAGSRLDISTPFDEREEFSKLGTKGKLQAIQVWYDNIIYGFKCTWIRKSSSAPNKVKQVIGSMHLPASIKADEVNQDVFMLHADEYISCVTVWIGPDTHVVYGITFETTQNRWHEFGGGMGTPILLQPPDKHAIHAFYGAFHQSLNCIGAYALPRKDYHSQHHHHHHGGTGSQHRRRSSTSKSFSKSKSKSKSHSKSKSKSKSRSQHFSRPNNPNSPTPTNNQLMVTKSAADIISTHKKLTQSTRHSQTQSKSAVLLPQRTSPNTATGDNTETKEDVVLDEASSQPLLQAADPELPETNVSEAANPESFADPSIMDMDEPELDATNDHDKQLKVQIQPPSPNAAESAKKKRGKFLWWNKK